MMLSRRLQWNEDDDADEKDSRQLKAARTCILKHMFHPKEFNMDPGLILELKADIQTECEKLGQVTTVKVYEVTFNRVQWIQNSFRIIRMALSLFAI